MTLDPSEFQIPHGADGQVLPHDHPNFGPGTSLIRRISAEQIVKDKNRDCNRLSSAVFSYDDPANHLSCDSPVCIEGRGADPATWVSTPGWLGALTLPLDKLREIQAGIPTQVGMVPLDDNACHGGVWAKINRGRANSMLRASDWLVPILNVEKCDGR